MSVLQILYRKVNIEKELTETERNEYIKKDICITKENERVFGSTSTSPNTSILPMVCVYF